MVAVGLKLSPSPFCKAGLLGPRDYSASSVGAAGTRQTPAQRPRQSEGSRSLPFGYAVDSSRRLRELSSASGGTSGVVRAAESVVARETVVRMPVRSVDPPTISLRVSGASERDRIITPYDAQRATITSLLKGANLPSDVVYNVDSFQGRETHTCGVPRVLTADAPAFGIQQGTKRRMSSCRPCGRRRPASSASTTA